jgi:hypothetical protein
MCIKAIRFAFVNRDAFNMRRPDTAEEVPEWIGELLSEINHDLNPFEVSERLAHCIFQDDRTGAYFCECHVKASKIIEHGTTDVPLDPEDQGDYRANRLVVEDAYAFRVMKDDAKRGRHFSNIVAEYTKEFDAAHPLKIIGGQHRFEALKEALAEEIDNHHGLKIYLGLTMDQRLDAQLISNTNIATSSDLFDRMQETYKGPQLRDWCQRVRLLTAGEDFSDRAGRGVAITVRMARTFITNYYRGRAAAVGDFGKTDTTPVLSPSGQIDEAWDRLRDGTSGLWDNADLQGAGREFSRLIQAQRQAFVRRNPKPPVDRPEKAMNAAVLSAWAYVAGLLSGNEIRLARHYALADTAGKDPLNAVELARARHRTDPDTYRGLGFRTDPKERGRMVELFYLQAEEGAGITRRAIELAIAKYHAKQAQLEVAKVEARGG